MQKKNMGVQSWAKKNLVNVNWLGTWTVQTLRVVSDTNECKIISETYQVANVGSRSAITLTIYSTQVNNLKNKFAILIRRPGNRRKEKLILTPKLRKLELFSHKDVIYVILLRLHFFDFHSTVWLYYWIINSQMF